MIAIQASGCAPVVRAYNAGASVCQMWQNASTFAAGLRVPKPYGDTMMLDILRASDGVALALTDEEILASILDWARNEGILLSPEGAAATAAYDRLLASGVLNASDRVVLFNTGAGLKYADVIAEAMHLLRPVSELLPA
jgi:threonine synthase